MALSSYFSTRIEFESSLRNFYTETENCPSEGTKWTWEAQPTVNEKANVFESFITFLD